MGLRRDRDDVSQDTGRLGYRTDTEPTDERPLLVWGQLWQDAEEQDAYERAVEEIQPGRRWRLPKPEDAKPRAGQECWMGLADLCTEITSLARGFRPQSKPQEMPRRMSQREWQRRQWATKQRGGLRLVHDEVE